jgi:hypothetical protein
LQGVPEQRLQCSLRIGVVGFSSYGVEQLARDSHQRLVPDPYRPVFEPVKLRRPVHRELPVTFVAFTQDQAVPPGPEFWHPGMSGRLNGATVTQVDGDHEILLSAPERLADTLHRAAMK